MNTGKSSKNGTLTRCLQGPLGVVGIILIGIGVFSLIGLCWKDIGLFGRTVIATLPAVLFSTVGILRCIENRSLVVRSELFGFMWGATIIAAVFALRQMYVSDAQFSVTCLISYALGGVVALQTMSFGLLSSVNVFPILWVGTQEYRDGECMVLGLYYLFDALDWACAWYMLHRKFLQNDIASMKRIFRFFYRILSVVGAIVAFCRMGMGLGSGNYMFLIDVLVILSGFYFIISKVINARWMSIWSFIVLLPLLIGAPFATNDAFVLLSGVSVKYARWCVIVSVVVFVSVLSWLIITRRREWLYSSVRGFAIPVVVPLLNFLPNIAPVVAYVIAILYGVELLCDGVRHRSRILVNYGFVVTMYLVLVKFLFGESSMAVKSLCAILGGLGLIAVNIGCSLFMRKNQLQQFGTTSAR